MVPTFNGAAFVTETLASLAAQDYPALRVVVSDDASTDATADICAAFVSRDERFSMLRQPARLGWIGNSNALITRADGEYAFFAQHDDLFEPAYVSRTVAALAAQPGAVLAYSDTMSFAPDGRCTIQTAERTVRPGSRLQRGLRYVIGNDPDRWVPMRGLVRTEDLRRIGGLRAWRGREHEADGRFLFRLHLLGPFARVADVLCHKRLHPGSLHRSWPRSRSRVMAQRAAYVREVLDADLRLFERVTLLAAVGMNTTLAVLPSRLRRPANRMLARLAT
jgi:glycosyltransferase involved in cell wall biosynthesis